MALPIVLVLALPFAWLATRSWRWAVAQFAVGALTLGILTAMRELRIVWPDVGFPLGLVLNPYLLLTLGYLLVLAGGVGIVAAARRMYLNSSRS